MSEDNHIVCRIEQANVYWRDPEVGTSHEQPVELLSNGWIHFPDTGQYYPPRDVEKVIDLDKEPKGSNHV